MKRSKHRVCPVERANGLDMKLRRWVQNPRKILGPYIKKGMTVLDAGCGPGFFTLDIAMMAGETGHVIAADLQDGMLLKLKQKICDSELEKRIILHKCEENRLGINTPVDFVLVFYMAHELPDQPAFFREIQSLLKQNGHILIVEPNIHVSKKNFNDSVMMATKAGFTVVGEPKVFFSKAVLLQKK